jgi:phospholipid/cholesterol/gamma-HCH transport system substrate-binding protein
MRRSILLVSAALVALCLTGCSSYKGINSLSLPGTVGTGSDSYQVKVQLNNAANLVPNVPVMINDINVGTVTKVELDGWTPTLTLSLRNDVKLPANAVAKLGQTSILGSKHIELAAPTDTPPEGTLLAGALIPQNRSQHYPETEEVLAGVSMLLNGGGLQHFQTITSELNRALGGRENDARDFLTQLNNFTGGLDKQKGDIVTALQGLDRFSGTLAPRMSQIDTALQSLPKGLRTLNDEEPDLKHALNKLGDASESIAPFGEHGAENLRDVLNDMEPVLRHTADAEDGSVISALKLLPFVIFPLDQIPYSFRGDYVDLMVTLNLTNEALDKFALAGTPGAGALAAADKVLQGRMPSLAGLQAGDPLHLPVAQPTGPGHADKAPLDALPMAPKPPAEGSDGGLLHKAVPGMGG